MAKDPYFSNVVLLMHGDDFTDVVTGATATLVGSPTIDTTEQKFGSGCLKLTPGNYITFPDSDKWDFGSAPFTIEFWAKPVNYGTYKTLFGHYLSGNPQWYLYTNGNGAPYFRFIDAGGNSYSGSNAYHGIVGGWTWFCVQRESSGRITTLSSSENSFYSYYTSNFFYSVTGGTSVMSIGSTDADVYIDDLRITKGIARYDTSVSVNYAPTEAYPDRSYEIWTDTLTDGVFAEGYSGEGNFDFDSMTDYVSANGILVPTEFAYASSTASIYQEPLNPAIGKAVTADETMQVTDAADVLMGSIITEYARLTESLGVGGRFSVAFNELVRLREQASAGVPVEITDTVGVLWALNVSQGATLAEKLGISEVLNYPFTFNYSVADAIGAYDTLARFLNYDISETITASETMTALARHVAAVNEGLTLTEDASPHFVLKLEVHDDAIFDDTFDLKMIYRPEVQDQITISAIFVDPSGGITAWAVNTRTGAVTEYEDFSFNSFCRSGNHYLGATSDGLYILDGADDAGSPTVSHLRSGYAQFGGSRFTGFAGAYLGMRGDGDIYLKLDTGDGKTYTYKTVVQDQQTTKVRLGKGLRARYFAFELITEGQDFDLDTIEFVPLVAQRRV